MSTYAQFKEFGPYLSTSGALYLLKIYHYLPGTTTLQNMWVERTKATTVAQPIESDSAGIASAFGDGIYKFRIDGSTDGVNYSTIYTFDNVAVTDQSSNLLGEGAAIASASTLTLGTDGNIFHVTGATGPITAISGTQTEIILVFDSTPTLTYSGNLILQYGIDFTVAANTVMVFFNEGSGVWREVSRERPSSLATGSGLTMTTARLLGRTTASTGAIEEITVSASLTLSGGALSGTAASDTQAGVIELATQAEVNTATDTARALHPNHNRIALGTPITTTSGTAHDFTGIPAGTRKIIISFVEVSLSAADDLLVQLGDAGGPETSGYTGESVSLVSTGIAHSSSTSGFPIRKVNAAYLFSGQMFLTLVDAATFTWVSSHTGKGDSSGTFVASGGGSKSLTAELTQVRVTRSAAATFDAGTINIMYER